MLGSKEVRRIDIKIDSKGAPELRKISNQFGKMNKNVKKTADSMSFLRNAFTALAGISFAGIGIGEIARFSDEFQLLGDRITSLTGDAEQSKEVFKDIGVAARITKSSIASLAEVYNRVALAVNDLGVSSDAVLGTTLALQQSFRLSGATIAEATGATIQLTQGLSAGALRGQELRSVLESNAVLSGLLAEKFGVARGQLIKLAETGAITSQKVFEVLSDNFDDLNESADALSQTFEQSLTIALDAVKTEIDKLNKSFDISGKFARGVEFFIQNFDEFSKVIGSGTIGVGVTALVGGIGSLVAAFGAASVGVVALIGSVAALGSYIYLNWDKIVNFMQRKWIEFQIFITESFDKITSLYDSFISKIRKALGKDDPFSSQVDSTSQSVSRLRDELERLNRESKNNENNFSFAEEAEKLIQRLKEGLDDAANSSGLMGKELKIANVFLSELNYEFRAGHVTTEDYYRQLEKIQKIKLDEDFERGAISLEKYTKSLTKFNNELTTTEQISAGVEDGINDYVKSIGTLATGISGLVNSTFKGMEDKLFEFVKTGKASFKDLTQSILDDMLRIAIRQQISGPLAGAIGGFFQSPASAGGAGATSNAGASVDQRISAGFATGGAFVGGNLQKFASGGVVDRPTFFSYNGGRTGVAGEAGAEGILPLKRGPSGNLGVEASGMGGSNVMVNVINQSDNSRATATERTNSDGTREIQVLVENIVNDGFSSGKFDRSMSQKYNLRARGS